MKIAAKVTGSNGKDNGVRLRPRSRTIGEDGSKPNPNPNPNANPKPNLEKETKERNLEKRGEKDNLPDSQN